MNERGTVLSIPTAGGNQIPVSPEELFIMIGMKETEIAKLQQALMKMQQTNQQQANIIKELQQKLAGAPDSEEKEEGGEKKEPGTAPTTKPDLKSIPKIKKLDKEE